MRSAGRRIVTLLALAITLWLIWSRLHIVFVVNLPWWGFLIFGVGLFLTIDYMLDRVLRGR